MILINVSLKKRCKYIIKKLLIMFLCLVVAFWLTVVVRLMHDWKEFKSPYPIMVEYYRVLYFGSYRSWMIEYGCSENNILFKWLEKQQKRDLEHIKSIIPEDDLLIDILEWQIRYEPYFMHTYHDTHFKIDGLIDWLANIRFKKSHIRQITEQFKFEYFFIGMGAVIQNGGCNGITSLNSCEKFAKTILPEIKKENYLAKIIMQSLFINITEGKIAMSNELWRVYTKKTCNSLYYPSLIKQNQELRDSIEELSGITRREKAFIKSYIKTYHSDTKQLHEFNKKYCLRE